jgi:excisionase family DNA binding protein
MSSNIKISRICQHCGRDFIAKTTVTKYCSSQCSKRAYKVRMRNSKIEESEQETQEIRVKSQDEIREKDYLTVKDVALLVGCSTRTVNKWVISGRLPAVRFSERKTIIKRSEMERLFKSSQPEVVYRVEPKKKEYKIEDCYTIAEAEEKSQMSSKALYDYIKRNDIPKIQNGKFVYVPRELIDSISS